MYIYSISCIFLQFLGSMLWVSYGYYMGIYWCR